MFFQSAKMCNLNLLKIYRSSYEISGRRSVDAGRYWTICFSHMFLGSDTHATKLDFTGRSWKLFKSAQSLLHRSIKRICARSLSAHVRHRPKGFRDSFPDVMCETSYR